MCGLQDPDQVITLWDYETKQSRPWREGFVRHFLALWRKLQERRREVDSKRAAGETSYTPCFLLSLRVLTLWSLTIESVSSPHSVSYPRAETKSPARSATVRFPM